MANNRVQVKRTSTAGRTPNTTGSYATNSQYISAGELALNMTDGILYTSDGTNLIEIGANNTNQRITNSLTVNNDKNLRFVTVNTSAAVSFVQQSDDNFVMYSTNIAYGQRAIWSVYANSITSNLQIQVPLQLNAGLVANGGLGSAGQVLTSNGTTTYWSTVSGGAGSVNTAAQYTWTNLHTFSANVAFTGNGIGLTTNTAAIYLGGLADNNWKIGRNTGSTTKWRYTNNSIDVITANSNLEGFAIGLISGNSYFETGYLGTFIAANVTIGNSSSNSTINSTAFSGSANNTTYVNGKTEGNLNVNNALTSNNTTYVNGKTEGNLNVNNALTSNNASFLGGNSASDLRTYSDNKAANAYSNAVSYVDGKSYVNTSQLSSNLSNYQTTAGLAGNVALLAANSATYLGNTSGTIANVSSWITTNAATAYTNSVSYTDSKILTANAAITGNAATAYTNAVSYVDNLKLDSVTNTSITLIPVANTVKNAYDRAIDANTRAASAQSAAIAAYTNSVSYTDSKILTANAAITGNAATAYSNSVSYTDSKILTANAAITGNAATAYTNAIAFASNASNINTGTLAEARLPFRMNQNLTTSNSVTFGSLTITGNLTVSGNVTVIGANALSVVDNMIYLNANNTTQNIDVGVVANYNSGAYAHTGIFRDASDGYWKVFDSYLPEPDANVNIDTTNTSFHLADFQANTFYAGNTSTNWFIANTAGVYHTGLVNAASFRVGTSTISNSTGVYTGVVNGSSITIGTAFTANATVVNAVSYYAGTTLIGNTTGPYGKTEGSLNVNNATTAYGKTEGNLNVNSATQATNATNLNSQPSSFYTNATNITTGTLPYAQIPANIINTTAAFTISGIHTYNANIVLGSSGLSANGSFGTAGHVLHSNGTATYWAADDNAGGTVTSVASGNGITGGTITTTGTLTAVGGAGLVVNTSGINVLANTGIVANSTGTFVNATYIETLSANNASFLGGTAAASYQLNSTLSANVATLTANNASFLGGTAAASYQLNSTLGANIASYLPTYTGVVNGSSHTVGSSFIANSTGVYTGVVNGSSHTVGTAFTANATMTNTVSLVVSTNTATIGTGTYFVSSGNVGIGTSSPTTKLHIQRSAGAASLGEIFSSDGTYWTMLNSRQSAGAYSPLVAAGDHALIYSDGTAETGAFVIGQWSSSAKGIRIDASGNVGIATATPGYKLEVNGAFAATTKSFVIDHPSKKGMKLRHGSLEGPENGVYVRGRTNTNIIELPDYWVKLIDKDSITVSLTAIGKTVCPSVGKITNKKINLIGNNIDCFFHVFAERKDVEKLVVEY